MWKALIDLIEPQYPKTISKGGRPPYPLSTMLRIHLLQQWYDLSDPAMEDALIEVPTTRQFAAIDMISDRIPDETTILAFRHLLKKHDLGQQIFKVVKAHLKANGMAMGQGTIIDATLIAAPCSTSTRAKPECAGGDRTSGRRGILNCTRPARESSGTTAARKPRPTGWIARADLSTKWKPRLPMCMTSPQPLISCTAPGLPKSMNQVVAPAIVAPPAPVPAGPDLRHSLGSG
jgi:transposase